MYLSFNTTVSYYRKDNGWEGMSHEFFIKKMTVRAYELKNVNIKMKLTNRWQNDVVY